MIGVYLIEQSAAIAARGGGFEEASRVHFDRQLQPQTVRLDPMAKISSVRSTGIVIPLSNQMPHVCTNSLKFGNRSVAAWMRITAKRFLVRAQTMPKKMPLSDRTTMA